MTETIKRRGFLAAGVALMTSLAGCNQDPGGLGGDPKPSYDHTLEINNNVNESRTVKVEITHVDSNELVYSDTHTAEGNSDVVVFDLEELKDSYSGIEDFEISAETEDNSHSTVYPTDSCHGAPEIRLYEDSVRIMHAIC